MSAAATTLRAELSRAATKLSAGRTGRGGGMGAIGTMGR
jgi:hypothetical protein